MKDLSNFRPPQTDTATGPTFWLSILEKCFSGHPVRSVLDRAQRLTCQFFPDRLDSEDSSGEIRSQQLNDTAQLVTHDSCDPRAALSSSSARVQRFDRLYKSSGMTHRVEAVIYLEYGGAEAATFWMRKPSEEAIQATLRRRGSLSVHNYQLIEL
ncbi:hypothetical protein KBJ94_23445 [Pseudomonas sp. ITA]|uniref:hypothetical protein n=1 Tax=Pseudomonas sp. ITA TaxID=2825841 RepID=UPI0024984069|nr:hypothetical protein [Pseudomonas sp. ITA]MDI2145008.1 hypothetical protein [Pseudomonas sp. ITA]